jgi:integrase
MAIILECPVCRRKSAWNTKKCSYCGVNLKKAKDNNECKIHFVHRENGKQIWQKVESLDDAEKLQKEYDRQRKDKEPVSLPNGRLTFQDLADWFLENESVKALSYYPTLRYKLRSFVAEFGKHTVSEIKPMQLENFQAKLKAKGYSDSYVDQIIGAARNALRKAVDNDRVSESALRPFRKISKILKRNSNARKRILTMEEINSLWKTLPEHSRLFLAIAFNTGMRRGEITSLLWSDIDFEKKVIRLRIENTKDREPREIPISLPLLDVLRKKAIREAGTDPHVILYKGKPVKDIRTAFQTASEKTGILYGRKKQNGFTVHDLRHTFNTLMRKAGNAEDVIMQITGHSTRDMFMRYDTVDAKDKKQAVRKFERLVEAVRQSVR